MPSLFDVHVDAFGRLVLTRSAQAPVVGVVPLRGFPLSAPGEWISLCDEGGHELVCLPGLDELSPAARALLLHELQRREFVPAIRRIFAISTGALPTEWHVDTDRGETRFLVPSEDHVRRLGPFGALISDTGGVRYRIVDLRTLDARGRTLLKRYL